MYLIKMRSIIRIIRIRVNPNSSDWCPYKNIETHRHIGREKGQVKIEAEIGVMRVQGK